jgi:hypothetical protein
MAGYTELYIDQGTDFSASIVLQDDDNNLYQNVDGYIITSSMKRSPLSPNTAANLQCSIINSANGEIGIALDAANTANLKTGRYFFDVRSNAANNYTRLIEGIITVTPSITK